LDQINNSKNQAVDNKMRDMDQQKMAISEHNEETKRLLADRKEARDREANMYKQTWDTQKDLQ
jgi:hypothetical protein